MGWEHEVCPVHFRDHLSLSQFLKVKEATPHTLPPPRILLPIDVCPLIIFDIRTQEAFEMENQLKKKSSKKLSKRIKVETSNKRLAAELQDNRKKSKWKKDEVEHRDDDAISRDKSGDEDLSSDETSGSEVSEDEFTKEEELVRNPFWKINR